MYPPVFMVLINNPGVVSVIGDRSYLFGAAPDNVQLPYCVWQVVSGFPENYINDRPDIDSFTIQFDVYADNPDNAREVAQAIRDAIEPFAHITSWRGESKDVETQAYRFGFDVDWWTNR